MSTTDSPHGLRAVAFDMDGLLASSEDVYINVGTETLRRRGKPFEDELRHQMMGLPGAKAVQVMIDWHALDDTVETLLRESDQLFWQFAEQGLDPADDVIAYCRIGERSSHTWFVLHHLLGFPTVRNYDGSWTEWGNLVRAPIER